MPEPTSNPARTASATPDIPGHTLTQLLGRGSRSTCWLGNQRSMERTVAIKVIELADEAVRAPFEAALRAASRMAHPAIAAIHHVGRTTDGRVFATMPFLPDDLRSQGGLQHKPLRVAAVLRSVLGALGYAHRHGIVHGGIKPSAIRLDENERVLLCDFGCATAAHVAHLPLASAGAAWMSPEQVRGAAPAAGDDLYALAVVAWELLTGAQPFQGSDALSIAMAHVQQPVPRLPAMLRAWQPWMDKALSKSPAARFHSAREMAQELAAVDGQHHAELPERPQAANDWRRWALGAGVVAGVALVAAGAWAFFAQPNTVESSSAPVIAPPPAVAVVTTAATPAVASTAPTTGTLAQQAQVFIARGNALRARGRLVVPGGNDALTAYLAARNVDPGNTTALAGIDAILARQAQELMKAWDEHALDRLPDLLAHGDLAAAHASSAATRAWKATRARLASEVGDALVAAAKARDTQRFTALKPLALSLPATFPPGFNIATAEQQANALRAGDSLRDRGGPALVYVPASGKSPAFALARVEVTRSDYAAFVAATHRPPSTCVVAYNVFSRLKHLNWQAPGFTQGGNHPVVCVSHQDALAYVEWLSRSTGQPYRLPDSAEWQRAAQGAPSESACKLGNIKDGGSAKCNDGGANTSPVGGFAPSGIGAYDMYGNVAEWLSGGNGRGEFRGRSWRSDSSQAALAPPSDTGNDTGYDNIGFRVLRVIDAAHPAPARVPGH